MPFAVPKDLTALIKRGALRSFASLAIKVATAGLTYVMYVVLSRSMGAQSYGYFAFGFSLATLLAVTAGLGQQTAILRYWPEENVAGRRERAVAAVQSGWALTLITGLSLALGLSLVALALGISRGGMSTVAHLFGAALLIVPMAGAEYSSAVLRAQDSIFTALSPRDLIWRILVPAIVWLLYLGGIRLSGFEALAMAAGILAGAIVLQLIAGARLGYVNRPGLLALPTYWREKHTASGWFWAATVLDSVALNIDVVLVGVLLSAQMAGIFFNAFRTAGLMTLFMFAIGLVIAPMISRNYYAGKLWKTQVIAALAAWAGFVFAIGVFVLFALFGGPILSLFGQSYVSGTPVLIILALGLMIDAATGPTRVVMMMTGQERAYVTIIGIVNLTALMFQIVLIPLYGIVMAALVNAVSRMVAQVAITVWTHRRVGLDPSVAGILAIWRWPDGKDAARAV